MKPVILAAVLAFGLAGGDARAAATRCDDVAAGRRCVTVQNGQVTSVCVTQGVTRTCLHYRDGRPSRYCVRIGGRNRCRDAAVRVAWSGVRAASGDRGGAEGPDRG